MPADSPGKSLPVTWPKPKPVSVLQICSGLQRQRDLGGADIAGLREDGRQVDHAEIVLVLVDLVADLEESGRGVHDAVGAVLSRGQRGGHDEGLDARAGLENIGGRAIAIQSRA